MNRFESLILSIAIALTPPRQGEGRAEQWLADLQDAADLGIPRWSIILGALHTAATSSNRQGALSGASVNESENIMDFSQMRARRRAITQLLGGTLAVTFLLAGVVTFAATNVEDLKRTIGIAQLQADPSFGPVTVVSLQDEPAPEWTDVSKLRIVGTIDPATGQIITDTPAPATAPGDE